MRRSELPAVQELLKQVTEYEQGLALFKTSTSRWELCSTHFRTFIDRDAARAFMENQLKGVWDKLGKNFGVYPDPTAVSEPEMKAIS